MQNCLYTNTLVTLEEFNAYSGNYEEGEDVVRLKIQLLQSAQSVVEEYLNYQLTSGLHIDKHVGFNNSVIFLDNKPVSEVNAVLVNDKDFYDYEFNCESIFRTDNKTFLDDDRITVEYETNVNVAPPLVKTTILRIATLMLMESGENIGITGKTANDGMSRSYISYANYDKYLKPLEKYRVFKL